MNNEKVNHPQHYAGKVECIDAMVAAFGTESVMDFCKINAFKYVWRIGKKDDAVQDAKKAVWYLNKYIELANCG